MDTDVLVVGAGPTGLMLANQLVRRGVRVRIIDRHAGPALQTRALGVQARTLEIYAKLGIVDRALELGKQRHRRQHVGARAAGWRASRSATPGGPDALSVHPDPRPGRQRAHHGREARTTRRCRSQWNTELVALEQQARRRRRDAEAARRHAAATVTRGVGRRMRRRAQRGARAQRHHFPGRAVRARVLRRRHRGDRARWCRTSSTSTCGATAFICSFRCAARITGGSSASCRRTCAHGRRRRSRRGAVDARRSGRRAVVQDVHAGSPPIASITARAARFRDRRCFLLGDAAHIHSPVGAQGMNTGLQDAYNLAWKLALVVKGRADAALLDSYEDERMPVAQRLLEHHRPRVQAGRLGQLARRPAAHEDHWRGSRRSRCASSACRSSRSARSRRPASTTARARCRRSLAGLPDSAPQAGDRFPWLRLKLGAERPGRGPVPETRRYALQPARVRPAVAAPGQPDVRRPGARARRSRPIRPTMRSWRARDIPQPSFYLLRPDGHVGLCGGRLDVDAVGRYLDEALRLA